MLRSRSVGGYVASEIGYVVARRLAKPQSDPLVLCILGRLSNADSLWVQGPQEPTISSITALVDAGYVVASGDYGSATHWGNPTSVTRQGQLKTYAQSNTPPSEPQAAPGGVYLFAKSMGTLGALNYARANPSLVKAIVAMWPAVDLADQYTNNRGGFQAEIGTTYGGAPPASSNPAANTADFAGIPIKLFYASGDTITPAANVAAFAAAVPSCSTVQIGTGDHGTQDGSFDINSVISFFRSHP